MSRVIDNPKHWRNRAEETRALARKVDDPRTKRSLLESADGYERLAQRAEGRKSLVTHNKTPRD
jgi:hypothetical protein